MMYILFLYLTLALSAPVKYVTRVHTAEAVTTTATYTTGTTTVWLPPVELFISNGVTYTFTQTDQPAASPTTYTSYFDNQGKAVDEEATTSKTAETTAETTEPTTAETTEQTTQQTNEQTTEKTTEQTTTAETTAAETTEQTTGQTTQQTTQQTTEQTTQQTTQQTTEQTTQQTTPTTSSTSLTSTKTDSSETSGSDSGSVSPPWGIVYSPYADDGSCKSESDVTSDLKYIKSKGISHIRTYGTDCTSLTAVLSASKSIGISVNQGLWIGDSGVDSIDDSVSDLISYIKENGDDVFDFITIGNEAVLMGYATASQLLDKVSLVKKQLQSAGYSKQVTTAEPPVSFTNNPELCDDNSPIDFAAINSHSYFNTAISAKDSGSFIMTEKELTEKTCSKSVKITETGYPSSGDTNGKNVPSPENQKVALQSILKETGGDVTILTTYNDYWKNPGPYNIEQYFGAAYLFE